MEAVHPSHGTAPPPGRPHRYDRRTRVSERVDGSGVPCADTVHLGADMPLTHRLATRDDLPALQLLIDAAIDELQKEYLTDAQIRSSRAVMGIDTQLID